MKRPMTIGSGHNEAALASCGRQEGIGLATSQRGVVTARASQVQAEHAMKPLHHDARKT